MPIMNRGAHRRAAIVVAHRHRSLGEKFARDAVEMTLDGGGVHGSVAKIVPADEQIQGQSVAGNLLDMTRLGCDLDWRVTGFAGEEEVFVGE